MNEYGKVDNYFLLALIKYIYCTIFTIYPF